MLLPTVLSLIWTDSAQALNPKTCTAMNKCQSRLSFRQRFVPSIGNIENAIGSFQLSWQTGPFLAVLTVFAILLNYLTFEGGFPCFNRKKDKIRVSAYCSIRTKMFIDRELALAVLYVCFCLLVVVLLPFLNLQAEIGNIG